MSCATLFRAAVVSSLALWVLTGCGAGSADVGRAPDGGSPDAGGIHVPICTPSPEVCDGTDNDCNGIVDDVDRDGDGFYGCPNSSPRDCDDNNPAVYPGAPEILNGIDDNCDGRIDYGVPDFDYDGDGVPFKDDCNDLDPLIGPNAMEVVGDGVDNNCDGQIDEVVDCEAEITGNTPLDFLRAIGICGPFVLAADFVSGNAGARSIRNRFGTNYLPKAGGKLIQLSSGLAVDNYDNPSYSPQDGHAFSSDNQTHPLWYPSDCYKEQTSAPAVRDMTELRVTMRVPQNAKSFSYQLNFFSAEYPEFVCTQFNDRFIAILESRALDPTTLPGGAAPNCVRTSPVPQCNISFDAKGQPLSINSGFFDVCKTDSANPKIQYTCGQPPLPALDMTGYHRIGLYEYYDYSSGPIGGATGWLTTKAPVLPGETITLRFIIFDEGDSRYDSAILLDNFQWDLQAVQAPTTDPVMN
jgi:hypothetical protein